MKACMHLVIDWVRDSDKQMPRVACRDLDPARRVSAQGEISLESLSQGEKRVFIRWGEEDVPIPRESLSMGGVECRYPKRRGEYPYPKRRVSLSQEERRGPLSQEDSVPIPRGEERVPIPRGEDVA